jgi:IQ domain-containing protein H
MTMEKYKQKENA